MIPVHLSKPHSGSGVQLVNHDQVHPYRVWYRDRIVQFCLTLAEANACEIMVRQYGPDVTEEAVEKASGQYWDNETREFKPGAAIGWIYFMTVKLQEAMNE